MPFMLSARQAAVYGHIAARFCRCSYAALSVQGCCTVGARMLHFFWHYYSKSLKLCRTIGTAMPNYRYIYAGLLVPECRTFLVLLLSLLDCYAEMQLILCKDTHFKNRESILSLYNLVFIGGSRDC